MGVYDWLHRSIASAALIAGLLISATFSAPGASAATSAVIAAVASVEYPVGGFTRDELQTAEARSDFQANNIITRETFGLPSSAGQILIYSPSLEISIEIMSVDGSRIDYQLLPSQSESSSSTNPGVEGPRMKLIDLTSTEVTTAPSQLIITLIPIGD